MDPDVAITILFGLEVLLVMLFSALYVIREAHQEHGRQQARSGADERGWAGESRPGR